MLAARKSILVCGLIAISCVAMADDAPKGDPKDPAVRISVGEPLAKARAALIKAGWKPVLDTYGYTDGAPERDGVQQKDFLKAGYVEIGACTGSGFPLCSLQYQDAKGRCLRVTLAGLEPESATIGGWAFECPDK